MPIYEYKCDDCGTEFEVLVQIEEETTCPLCDGKSLTKKLSTFGISTGSVKPDCAAGCGGGFSSSCGSGMCCG